MLSINFLRTSKSIGKRSANINKKASNIESLMRFSFFIVIFVVTTHQLSAVSASESLGNPYKILGVHKRATLQEIRKAYKNLVKEWYILNSLLYIIVVLHRLTLTFISLYFRNRFSILKLHAINKNKLFYI